MEGPLIISNTTPLINFAEIGRLDLLSELFGTVVIPPAVEAEVSAKSALFPTSSEPATASSPIARAAMIVVALSTSFGVIRWTVQARVIAKGR